MMTYNFSGSWNTVTGHNAALKPYENPPVPNPGNIQTAVEYWLSQGAPPSKINLGIPFYGITYNLTDPAQNGVGAPVSGVGIGGQYTIQPGIIGYNEVGSRKIQFEYLRLILFSALRETIDRALARSVG
jgi:chitinase